jgi:hypothetical protein
VFNHMIGLHLSESQAGGKNCSWGGSRSAQPRPSPACRRAGLGTRADQGVDTVGPRRACGPTGHEKDVGWRALGRPERPPQAESLPHEDVPNWYNSVNG